MKLAVWPLLVHQHAVHEQLEIGIAEANDNVVPLVRPDQFHRGLKPQHAIHPILVSGELLRQLIVEILRLDLMFQRLRSPQELQRVALPDALQGLIVEVGTVDSGHVKHAGKPGFRSCPR